MVIIRSALRIPGCAPGSSELSYREVAARDYRVPEGIDHCRTTVLLALKPSDSVHLLAY